MCERVVMGEGGEMGEGEGTGGKVERGEREG